MDGLVFAGVLELGQLFHFLVHCGCVQQAGLHGPVGGEDEVPADALEELGEGRGVGMGIGIGIEIGVEIGVRIGIKVGMGMRMG